MERSAAPGAQRSAKGSEEPAAPGTMRVLLLFSALAWLVVCQQAAELGQNATEQKENVPVAWDHREDGNMASSEIDYGDMGEEEEEEEEEEPAESLYIVDDSLRVEPVVKPKQTKTERGKTSNKTKKRKNNERKNKKKKGTPCEEEEHKSYCIHGECQYLENLKGVTCKCHQDYFGERCGEQSMKSQQRNDTGNCSTTILVVAAILLSSVSFVAVIIFVIMQIRKTCSRYEEKEERKKLRQENGNGHVAV